jgi:hypothetical protein
VANRSWHLPAVCLAIPGEGKQSKQQNKSGQTPRSPPAKTVVLLPETSVLVSADTHVNPTVPVPRATRCPVSLRNNMYDRWLIEMAEGSQVRDEVKGRRVAWKDRSERRHDLEWVGRHGIRLGKVFAGIDVLKVYGFREGW